MMHINEIDQLNDKAGKERSAVEKQQPFVECIL